MTTFFYTAKKNTAETVTGQITAEDQEEAIELINQLGFLPVSVEEQVSGENNKNSDFSNEDLRTKKKIKTKELYIFSRQLANLLKAGVPILRSLDIIEEQTQNHFLKKIIAQVAKDIKNGKTLSESLKVFPNVFSFLYITMVRAGEESGNLREMLVSIANYQRRQEEILSKVRTALVYPMVMAVVGLATIWFVLVFVLPKMAGLFQNMGDALPLPTAILLGMSDILGKWWMVILLGILAGVFSLKRFFQSDQGRVLMSRFLLKMPLFGEIILKAELARFCRTLLLLFKSGVSIVRAIPIVIPILSNELIKKQLAQCNEDLTSGGSFGESLKRSTAMPAMMGHLIAVGEESGNLNEVLGEIAGTYEQETDENIKIMTTLLEPIMILGIGLAVGFIVFAILLPIFQMDVLG